MFTFTGKQVIDLLFLFTCLMFIFIYIIFTSSSCSSRISRHQRHETGLNLFIMFKHLNNYLFKRWQSEKIKTKIVDHFNFIFSFACCKCFNVEFVTLIWLTWCSWKWKQKGNFLFTFFVNPFSNGNWLIKETIKRNYQL